MERKPIIEKCVGCTKITPDNFCAVYINPEGKWLIGGCGVSTHISKLTTETSKKLNPIKASKRMKKKK